MRVLMAGGAALALGLSAHASGPCPNPGALSAQAVPFSELYAAVGGGLEKGEFESTAQFEQRKAANRATGPVLVSVDIAPEAVSYDADRQAFFIYMGQLESTEMYFDDYWRPDEIKKLIGTLGHNPPMSIKASETVVQTDSYTASNAFGATTTVSVQDRTYGILFEERGGSGFSRPQFNIFDKRGGKGLITIDVPVPAERAPELKGKIQFVALAEPKAPYAITFENHESAKIDRPRDETSIFQIVIADIQCFAARGPDGNILAHWKTR